MKIYLLNIFRQLRLRLYKRKKNNLIIKESKGIIFIVFKDFQMLNECIVSVISIRKYNKLLNITIFTDNSDYLKEQFLRLKISLSNISFQNVLAQQQRAKVDYIDSSPYDRTLYLDCDTILKIDPEVIIDGLKYFDVLFTPDFSRKRQYFSKRIPEYNDIALCVPEVNGGVFAFRNNDNTKELFQKWQHYFYKYFKQTNGYDQASLRISISLTKNLKSMIIPYEYNTRPHNLLIKCLNTEGENYKDVIMPKIVHKHFNIDIPNKSFKQIIEFIETTKTDDLALQFSEIK